MPAVANSGSYFSNMMNYNGMMDGHMGSDHMSGDHDAMMQMHDGSCNQANMTVNHTNCDYHNSNHTHEECIQDNHQACNTTQA